MKPRSTQCDEIAVRRRQVGVTRKATAPRAIQHEAVALEVGDVINVLGWRPRLLAQTRDVVGRKGRLCRSFLHMDVKKKIRPRLRVCANKLTMCGMSTNSATSLPVRRTRRPLAGFRPQSPDKNILHARTQACAGSGNGRRKKKSLVNDERARARATARDGQHSYLIALLAASTHHGVRTFESTTAAYGVAITCAATWTCSDRNALGAVGGGGNGGNHDDAMAESGSDGNSGNWVLNGETVSRRGDAGGETGNESDGELGDVDADDGERGAGERETNNGNGDGAT